METETVGIDHLLGKACALCQRMRRSGLNAGTAGDERLVSAMINYIGLTEEGVPIDRITYTHYTGEYEFHKARVNRPQFDDEFKALIRRVVALEDKTADN